MAQGASGAYAERSGMDTAVEAGMHRHDEHADRIGTTYDDYTDDE